MYIETNNNHSQFYTYESNNLFFIQKRQRTPPTFDSMFDQNHVEWNKKKKVAERQLKNKIKDINDKVKSSEHSPSFDSDDYSPVH